MAGKVRTFLWIFIGIGVFMFIIQFLQGMSYGKD